MHHLSLNNQKVTMSDHQVFVDHQCRRKSRRFRPLSTLLTVTYTLFLMLSLYIGNPNGRAAAEDPEFAEAIENITVPAGREVRLACAVKNLGPHKVAWIHFEGSAILTVQTHVITRNPRISVSHDKHRTFFLQISDVSESDAGRYMCQINTETAKTQFGYLHVVVPPNIDDSMSSSDVIVRENSNVSLSCHATGSPQPTVKWRREDGGDMRINKTFSVSEWEGPNLDLSRISRLDMGAYLCIASNSVPPAVSKRMKISVDFPPMMQIPHQLVAIPAGFTVVLECVTEANPASLNYWTREDGNMIHDNRKYKTHNEIGVPNYRVHMKLVINDVQHPKDFGVYKCVAKNPRGETDGVIRVTESFLPSTTTIPTTTTKPHRKHKDQREKNDTGRKPSSLAVGFSEKGSDFTGSNLNTVDKSRQRSTSGDSVEWLEGNSPSSNSSSLKSICYHILASSLIILLHLHQDRSLLF